MKTRVLLLLVVFASLNCFAQEKKPQFGFELDGGVSLALKKLDDAKMKVAIGFEGTFHYRFYKHLGAYAGWGWNRFASENSFAGKGWSINTGLKFNSLNRKNIEFSIT